MTLIFANPCHYGGPGASRTRGQVGLLSGMVIEASSKRQHTNGKSAAPRCWIAVKPTLISTDLVDVIDRLVTAASQYHTWLRDLTALREQVNQNGGLRVGASKEEVVERLRQTRHEIFGAEYAHLYR